MTYAIQSARSLEALGELLARHPAAVGEIAREMPVSRPAVSQHLRVLKEASLVTGIVDGARHIYRLDPRGVAAMRDWLDAHWSAAMESFQAFADETESNLQTPEKGAR
jgi:DNA-binding transcriptional ArsR family regulator